MRWLIAFLFVAGPVMAEEVVLGLSRDKVAITATFDGSEILVFGAVKREEKIPEEPLDVIVAIAGPSKPVVVRRKERRFGIWVNTDAVEVDRAPSFYAIATTGPLDRVLSNVEDLRHSISIPRAIRAVGTASDTVDPQAFTEAIIRIRKANGAYSLQEGAVSLDEQTLFRTSIAMPANLTEGAYTTRIFLTRGGEVVSTYETAIGVQKVGLERWIFNLSREQPLIYGLMSLAIAIAAGWGASAAFRAIRDR
ncbi:MULTISPECIES: TIGR02186 family protein [Roseovarius]|uniref:TIGR02186 family protein n=1 Tax=Roseovarius TaxID=74030 RepID=UPI001C958E24|nr:TIGR02186 family protein [Roseovarius atlanticus]MBY5986600.1 TIGR02186 family protein [Roseovarius atlanticus]MBY6125240.1 TIGR02186 family protein [Roseovarius atlanticus]MBY6150299.1 TIGR02186 family protein [Roseovarius atlanticus]